MKSTCDPRARPLNKQAINHAKTGWQRNGRFPMQRKRNVIAWTKCGMGDPGECASHAQAIASNRDTQLPPQRKSLTFVKNHYVH